MLGQPGMECGSGAKQTGGKAGLHNRIGIGWDRGAA
jgi:hypothetical protein